MVGNGASISSPGDFVEEKLGVISPGSSTDLLTQYFAGKFGAAPSNYTTVAAGAGATSIAAFSNGGRTPV